MKYPDLVTRKKYADVLIKCALNAGKGIKPEDVVLCWVPELAQPMLEPLQQSILEAGGHPLIMYEPVGLAKPFYTQASDAQLEFFPDQYLQGLVNQIDHLVAFRPEGGPKDLEGVNAKKIMAHRVAWQPFRKWRNDKEARKEYTWTLGWWGTSAYAKEARMTLTKYWDEIIKACYLNLDDPIAKWKEVFAEVQRVRDVLNSIPIKSLHVKGSNVDLQITIGEKRKWVGGSGRNIPSFEIFTSPDWRGTEGWITFDKPLYYEGNLIKGIHLEFKDGVVVKASATKNEKVLLEMIAQENANKIGEFSLTDGRLSPITAFMANTLFDENAGGPFGNTHIALGMAYQDAYDGDPTIMKTEDWEEIGFNDVNCPIHTDIISTEDRTVTATLKDGSTQIIYSGGEFRI